MQTTSTIVSLILANYTDLANTRDPGTAAKLRARIAERASLAYARATGRSVAPETHLWEPRYGFSGGEDFARGT